MLIIQHYFCCICNKLLTKLPIYLLGRLYLWVLKLSFWLKNLKKSVFRIEEDV